MIASSNAQSRPEVIDKRPDSCLKTQLSVESSDAAEKWNDEDKSGVDPIDMAMPITQCEGLFTDVQLLAIGSNARHGFECGSGCK